MEVRQMSQKLTKGREKMWEGSDLLRREGGRGEINQINKEPVYPRRIAYIGGIIVLGSSAQRAGA